MLQNLWSDGLALLTRIGADKNDSEEVRLQKAVLVRAALMFIPMGALWGVIYVWFGEPLAGAIPLSYSALSLVSIVIFGLTGRYHFFRFSQLLLILVLPFLLMVTLGGFADSSAVITWSFLCPLGALLFSGPRYATRWAITYCALIILSGLLGTYLRPSNNLPSVVKQTFFVLNIGGVPLVSFVLLNYFIGQKDTFASMLRQLNETLQQELKERKRAEEALRESEERYRLITDAATDAIITINGESRVLFLNPATEKMFGYTRSEMLGQPLTVLMPEPLRARHLASLQRYIETGQQHITWEGVELSARHQSGREFPVEISFSEIVKEGQHLFTGIVRDITARKRAEEALRRRASELAALHATALEITASQHLPSLLQLIVERAVRLLHATSAKLYLCDVEQREVRVAVSYNAGHEDTGAVLQYGEGAAGIVAQTGKPLVIDEYATWPGRATVSETTQPFAAVLSVPMIWRGQVTGVVTVVHAGEDERFTQADVELLSLFADQAATAVENARMFDEVRRLAVTDYLTGAHNRRSFFTLAEREFNRARRFRRPLSVIMLDIDHFKQVNDTYGHAVGDEVLRGVVEHCRKHIRDIDILGRYGGEEFTIMLPESDLRLAYKVAERLRQSLAESSIPTNRGFLKITISLGIAEATAEIADLDVLLDRADAAMYAAKQAGRNCVMRG